jgi:hypothetical protein
MGKISRPKTFTAWLQSYHAPTLSKLLGLDSATVYLWIADKERTPRPAVMRRIKELSKGVVTYEMMIDRNGK